MNWRRFLVASSIGLLSVPFAPVASPQSSVLDATARDLSWFNTHCVSLADMYVPEVKRICRVNVFRPLGAVSGRRVYFALYRRLVVMPGDKLDAGADHVQAGSIVDRPPFSNTAVVIFEEPDPGRRERGNSRQ